MLQNDILQIILVDFTLILIKKNIMDSKKKMSLKSFLLRMTEYTLTLY